jgi:hypothetical protein
MKTDLCFLTSESYALQKGRSIRRHILNICRICNKLKEGESSVQGLCGISGVGGPSPLTMVVVLMWFGLLGALCEGRNGTVKFRFRVPVSTQSYVRGLKKS